MTIIVGFDLSSKKIAVTSTSTLDEEHIFMATFALPRDECERCYRAMVWVRDLIGTYTMTSGQGPTYVFVEKPVMGRGGPGSTIPQAQVSGAVLAGAWEAGAQQVMLVNNTQWKKSVLGSGNAGKSQIKAGIYELWRAAYEKADGDQDLLDSAGVNRFGHQVFRMHARIERERARPAKRLVRAQPRRLVKR